ncbi:flagellar hook-length control protein FliK [Shewanella acanthi]|uniref:flagellar hook-length control protein FliK n=1 Tax=Shewanella acanthi TaxID=2864212 RepID=UPI001C65FA51|nr:flagellar hook-length control protein FliK [Shewanella acanthi]QYJ79895.1 flagellar hook-length control protein FliK [Shewanella acanthi]
MQQMNNILLASSAKTGQAASKQSMQDANSEDFSVALASAFQPKTPPSSKTLSTEVLQSDKELQTEGVTEALETSDDNADMDLIFAQIGMANDLKIAADKGEGLPLERVVAAVDELALTIEPNFDAETAEQGNLLVQEEMASLDAASFTNTLNKWLNDDDESAQSVFNKPVAGLEAVKASGVETSEAVEMSERIEGRGVIDNILTLDVSAELSSPAGNDIVVAVKEPEPMQLNPSLSMAADITSVTELSEDVESIRTELSHLNPVDELIAAELYQDSQFEGMQIAIDLDVPTQAPSELITPKAMMTSPEVDSMTIEVPPKVIAAEVSPQPLKTEPLSVTTPESTPGIEPLIAQVNSQGKANTTDNPRTLAVKELSIGALSTANESISSNAVTQATVAQAAGREVVGNQAALPLNDSKAPDSMDLDPIVSQAAVIQTLKDAKMTVSLEPIADNTMSADINSDAGNEFKLTEFKSLSQTSIGSSQPQRADIPQLQLSLRQNVEGQNQMQDMIQRFSPVMKQQLVTMVSQGIQQAEIRLDPPELGHMLVKVHVQGDQTQVQFQVSNAQTRDVVEQAIPRLRELLQEQGMQLADSHVSHGDQGQHQQGAFSDDAVTGSGNMDDFSAEELDLSSNQATSLTSGIDYYA